MNFFISNKIHSNAIGRSHLRDAMGFEQSIDNENMTFST